jgi:hypothetical protein
MPSAIVAMAAGNRVRPVWRNELGGLTFEMTDSSGRRFVKWAPAGTHLNLTAEASRLRWAAPFTPVPAVLGEGRDGAGSWLITAGLPGRNAVDAIWKAEPLRAVQAIGQGLRAFHEALPVAQCPSPGPWRTDWPRRRRGRRLPSTSAAWPISRQTPLRWTCSWSARAMPVPRTLCWARTDTGRGMWTSARWAWRTGGRI